MDLSAIAGKSWRSTTATGARGARVFAQALTEVDVSARIAADPYDCTAEARPLTAKGIGRGLRGAYRTLELAIAKSRQNHSQSLLEPRRAGLPEEHRCSPGVSPPPLYPREVQCPPTPHASETGPTTASQNQHGAGGAI